MAKKILLVQTMNVHRQLLYESVVQSAEITEDSVAPMKLKELNEKYDKVLIIPYKDL